MCFQHIYYAEMEKGKDYQNLKFEICSLCRNSKNALFHMLMSTCLALVAVPHTI